MSYDYAPIIATAARLIDRFGRDVVRTRVTGGSTDPVTGVVTPGTTTNTTFRGINQRIPLTLVDGSRVLASDRMLVMEASASPLMTDKFDGWNVEEIQEVKPANSSIVWFVRIRK